MKMWGLVWSVESNEDTVLMTKPIRDEFLCAPVCNLLENASFVSACKFFKREKNSQALTNPTFSFLILNRVKCTPSTI